MRILAALLLTFLLAACSSERGTPALSGTSVAPDQAANRPLSPEAQRMLQTSRSTYHMSRSISLP